MTSIGKSLVLVNFVLSLMMAAWAQSIYADRTDWSNARGKEGAPDGELLRRINRLSELGDASKGALAPAANSWNASRVELAVLDERREKDQVWYAAELAFDRSGATRANPAHVVKLVDGQPVLVKPGSNDRPVMEAGRDAFGQPLQSMVAYNQAEDALNQQNEVVSKGLVKAIEEDKDLTNRLIGEGANKGLQQRILDERAKMKEAINEQGFVRPLLINAVVESDLVFRRQRALEARINELHKTGVVKK